MSIFYNLNFDEVIACYEKYKNYKKLNELQKIENIELRAVVYEILSFFPEEIVNSELLLKVYNILVDLHTIKEKNVLKESKMLLNFKNLFSKSSNDQRFFYFKLSYVITRRMYIAHGSDVEFNSYGKLELSLLLEQISSDINSYITFLKIFFKTEIDIEYRTLKTYVLRAIWVIANKKDKIEIELKKINNKTVYFVRSMYKSKNDTFIHFYAKINLCPPKLMVGENYGLNGGFHFLSKKIIIEPSKYNTKTCIHSNIESFISNQNNLGFHFNKNMIVLQEKRVQEQLYKDKILMDEGGEYFKNINNLSYEEINRTLSLEKYKSKMRKNEFIRDIDNENELKKINEKIELPGISQKKLDKLEAKKNKIENLIKKKNKLLSSDTYKKGIQRDFSYAFILKIYYDVIEYLIDYSDKIYFTTYFDFRGRYYHNSLISPTQGGPFRFLYHYGMRDEDVEIKTEHEWEYDYSHIFDVIEKKVGALDKIKKNNVLWVLFSIGAILIKKNNKIHEKEFIDAGLEGYKNYTESKDNLENDELMYYYEIIDTINTSKNDYYIIKDVSGSIFQNGAVILGNKDDKSLETLNINGKVGNDPYYPIIEKITKIVDEDVKKYMNRKTLKKSIMTRYYSSTLLTSFKYFMQEVRKRDDYERNNDGLYDKLFKNFKIIYGQLSNLEKEILFANSIDDLIEHLKINKITDIVHNDFSFNLVAYKLKPTRLDIEVEKKRVTTTTYTPSKEIGTIKTKNSIIPNLFHAEDANRAREIIRNFDGKCFSIHDAFAVSFQKVDELIKIANKTFKLKSNNKAYPADNKNDIYYSKNMVV